MVGYSFIVENIRKRLVCFIKQQKNELRKDGKFVFLRKCYTMFLMLPALLVVCIVRILRPFILIRLAPLNSGRIGSFAGFIDIYLSQRNAGMHKGEILDLFYYTFPISSQQLNKMLSPYLNIVKCPHFANLVYKINLFLPGGKTNNIPLTFMDVDGFRGISPSFLRFNKEEELFGLEQRRRLGVPDEAEFICFHARDSAYLKAVYPKNDFSYLDHRNVNIDNFIPAVEALSQRGYYMLRMGAVVNKPLCINNPKIIDYAIKYRTDFLDIYLPSKCKFFICVASGIAEIPQAFRRPVVWTNWLFPYQPLGFWNIHDLIIPRKYWLKKENRFLTFRESINYGLGSFCSNQEYVDAGIALVENTPNEILDLVIEMDDRLKGVWVGSEEDEDLQQCFWSLYKDVPSFRKVRARIGVKFLRQNKFFLD